MDWQNHGERRSWVHGLASRITDQLGKNGR